MDAFKNKFNLVLLIISFLEGACLMSVEIVSSKLISPFFGNSLYVWTSILSITIFALTLGYLIGGRISVLKNPLKNLRIILFISFFLLLNNILFGHLLLDNFVELELKIGLILTALFLIFPIIFCFGLISPIIINILASKNLHDSVGQNVGTVYTISTVGGVLMTFISGLYFVPYLGVKFTLYIILGLLLIAIILSILLNTDQAPIKEYKKEDDYQVKSLFSPVFVLFYFLAFIEGAMVIVIELFGSKMIQPILGNSFIIWSIVIGLTITFLTMGYYLGGKLSNKQITINKWLSSIFALVAIYMVAMPMISIEVAQIFIQKSLYLGAFVICSILIGPPLIMLGMTPPLIIQLLNSKREHIGKISGNVYAISSLGGILSTLIIGMYILPEYGIVNPILIFSFILFLISIILIKKFTHILYIVPLTIIALVTYSSFNTVEWESKNIKIKHISEGLLGQLKVFDEYFPIEELEYRFLLINGICQTMIVNHHEVVSTWKYIHRTSRIASLKRNKNALILGLGGGSMASELNKLNIKADLVDIDKRMFELSKDYFFYKDSNATFYDDDARHFINKCHKKYDLIIVDLASGENQPNNIFTVEGLTKIGNLLHDDGLVIINFQEKVNSNKISAHHSICNTILGLGFKLQMHKTTGKALIL
jgi:predicted membrane-bound spermidine synthase